MEESPHPCGKSNEVRYRKRNRSQNRLREKGSLAHEPSEMGNDRFAQSLLHITRTGNPMDLNQPNRHLRIRMSGGVGGLLSDGESYSDRLFVHDVDPIKL